MAQVTREKAFLILASGRIFQGFSFGAKPSDKSQGEVVFNTSLTGYQEILTDPSYEGQIVAMTPSHIGNYGTNDEDVESRRIFLSGFVVQELSEVTSNWRSSKGLDQYLAENNVAGITGVDTRALTRHLRSQGSVNGLITLASDTDALIKKAKGIPSMEGLDLAQRVSADQKYEWKENSGEWKLAEFPSADPKKVVVIDYGVKYNILRCLKDRNCQVTVVPAKTPAGKILDLKPDGILLSNGPGDPAVVSYGIKTVQDLVAHDKNCRAKGEKPVAIYGICLGHQILSLALGAKTYKLKFGHHGANHPVKDLFTGKVDITTQNHGFAVKAEEVDNKWVVKENPEIEVTHVSLNDHSVEGIRHKGLPLASVQYHPEASAGPHDPQHLFDRFMDMMN